MSSLKKRKVKAENAVLLLSGGLDSTCLAFWLRPALALTVDYGQRCLAGELRASKQIAELLRIEHETIRCDLASFGSGDMSGAAPIDCAPVAEWWPFRNQLLITVGAMAAIKRGLSTVLIGCVKSDARHADGRARFVNQIDNLVSGQEGGITVLAPAIELTTSELAQHSRLPMSLQLAVFSCHRAEYACGICSGCRKTISVLEELKTLA